MSNQIVADKVVVQSQVSNINVAEDMQLHLLLRKITSEFETALEAFFTSWGITTTRFVVLHLLYNSQNGMTPTETAKAVGVTNATISAIISGLKQADLIRPVQNAGDSRSYRMQLSDSGLALMMKILPAYNENIANLWAQFDGSEKKNLGTLMTRLSQVLGVMGRKI